MNTTVRVLIWVGAITVVAALAPRPTPVIFDPPLLAPLSEELPPTCRRPAGPAHGVVVDKDGAPVAGVLVVAGDQDTHTDAGGAYTIDRATRTWVGLWGVENPSRCPDPRGDRWIVDACALSLTVVGPDGLPVEGWADVLGGPRRLDDTPLMVEPTATVRVFAPGMWPQRVTVEGCEPAQRTVQLERGTSIPVTVLGATKASEITVLSATLDGEQVHTRDDGTWDLALPSGPFAAISASATQPRATDGVGAFRLGGSWRLYYPLSRFGEDISGGLTLALEASLPRREIACLGVPDADCDYVDDPRCASGSCSDAVDDLVQVGRHTVRARAGQRVVWVDLRDEPSLTLRGEPGGLLQATHAHSWRGCRVSTDGTCVVWVTEPGTWRIEPFVRDAPRPLPGDAWVKDVVVPDAPGVWDADLLPAPR